MALQALAPFGVMAVFGYGLVFCSKSNNRREHLEVAKQFESRCIDEFQVVPPRTRHAPVYHAHQSVDLTRLSSEPVISVAPAEFQAIVPGSVNDPYRNRRRPIPLHYNDYYRSRDSRTWHESRTVLDKERYWEYFHNPENVKKYGTISRMEAVARDPSVLIKDPAAFIDVAAKVSFMEQFQPFMNLSDDPFNRIWAYKHKTPAIGQQLKKQMQEQKTKAEKASK